MGFDLQYLLFLQNLRESTGGVFDEFFNALSKFAVDILPYLPFVVYWCVNKKLGYRFMATAWIGEVLNGVIKLTVCAYRPWIRSDSIVPAGDSKVAATGYSFPSGHSLCAAMYYGSAAVWQWNKRRWISILCGVLILLTGFSRNFLGVHTPQDVVVGITEGLLLVAVVIFAEKRVADNDKALDILTVVGILVAVGVILYITLKPYPMDYVDGKLLVDPQKMMNDSFKACGGFSGLLIGSYIERHFIRYEIPQGSLSLPILSCVGFALLFAWKELLAPATIMPLLGGNWGNLITGFLMVFFAVVVWPLVIRKTCTAKSGAAQTA
ncbi:phosphatase PAP2 family protein [Ruminococcus sp.]|uniref:phosphatase PAP2 family protein n=1 Tax=Ruminococcus sp. TaxID=41978 RepID=UPI003867367E